MLELPDDAAEEVFSSPLGLELDFEPELFEPEDLFELVADDLLELEAELLEDVDGVSLFGSDAAPDAESDLLSDFSEPFELAVSDFEPEVFEPLSVFAEAEVVVLLDDALEESVFEELHPAKEAVIINPAAIAARILLDLLKDIFSSPFEFVEISHNLIPHQLNNTTVSVKTQYPNCGKQCTKREFVHNIQV